MTEENRTDLQGRSIRVIAGIDDNDEMRIIKTNKDGDVITEAISYGVQSDGQSKVPIAVDGSGRTIVSGGVVSCPVEPVEIPGIVAADAFDANDCFGTVLKIKVPKSGVLYSATYWDLDDEGTQLDLQIFKRSYTAMASDAAYSPTDADMIGFITSLTFVSFEDHINSQTSEVTNIGKAYTAPEGYFYIQAVDRATKTIAAENMPRIQLQIISYDSTFSES
jgi:hypothetical protein